MLLTAIRKLEAGVYHARPMPLTPLLKSQQQILSLQDNQEYLFSRETYFS